MLKEIILLSLIFNLLSLSIFATSISKSQVSELIKAGKIIPVSTNNDNSKCIMLLQIDGKKFCSLVPLDEKPQQNIQKVWRKIKFDERSWKATWSNNYPLSNSVVNVVEYIVNSENINAWEELITETSITGENVQTANKYASSFISNKEMKITSQIFNSSDQETF